MNIAVCISSRLRSSWNISIPYIINYFKQYNCNIDYFFTTSNIVVNRHKIWGESYISYIQDDDISKVKEYLQPKVFYIENNYYDINKLLENYNDIDLFKKDNYYYLYQLFSMELCNNLKKIYCIENNIKYDVVFKIRPDMILINHIDNNKMLDHLNSLEDCIYTYEYNEDRMSDCFFYGNDFTVNKFLKNAADKIICEYKTNQSEIRSEYGFRLLAKLSDVKIKSSSDKLYSICLRKSATIDMTINQLKELEHKDQRGC